MITRAYTPSMLACVGWRAKKRSVSIFSLGRRGDERRLVISAGTPLYVKNVRDLFRAPLPLTFVAARYRRRESYRRENARGKHDRLLFIRQIHPSDGLRKEPPGVEIEAGERERDDKVVVVVVVVLVVAVLWWNGGRQRGEVAWWYAARNALR